MYDLPYFTCDNAILTRAWRLALGCVAANTVTVQTGVLKEPSPCVMAGLDYATPWTRDAAINVEAALAVLDPKAAKNTLLSVLEEKDGKVLIGDQYWDKIIWSMGAWKLWQVTGDREFLTFARNVIRDTMETLEAGEFDPADGLFRGPAVYGDGVSAYPEPYRNPNLSSAIVDWPGLHPDLRVPTGGGMPMKALSTNCVYFESYRILAYMAEALGEDGSAWGDKAEALKAAINKVFWNGSSYDYLAYESNAREGLGLSFALLFDIADEGQAVSLMESAKITDYGIPCVWPCFAPYGQYGVGRHCGTVWPHVQGYWAKAMLYMGRQDRFDHELFSLAENAVRDGQFTEIYHPETGLPYGGIQEGLTGYFLWDSCSHQTWSATAYIRMILEGVMGMDVSHGLTFSPNLPKGVERAELRNFLWQGRCLDILADRNGVIVREAGEA